MLNEIKAVNSCFLTVTEFQRIHIYCADFQVGGGKSPFRASAFLRMASNQKFFFTSRVELEVLILQPHLFEYDVVLYLTEVQSQFHSEI